MNSSKDQSNQLSVSPEDRSVEERILNAIRSDGKQDDWRMPKAIADGIIIQKDFKESRDLREDDWWEIGNQGNTSSCVGWASTDSVLRYHLVKEGRMEKTDKLSVRFTWMAAKQMEDPTATYLEDAGTPMKVAVEVFRKIGSVPENDFPFDQDFSDGYDTSTFFDLASQFKIKSYYCLRWDDDYSLDNFRMWIDQRGPLFAMIDVDSSLMSYSPDLHSWDEESYKVNNSGHAVAIVGYTKDHFIIRNSWGSEYGENGYAFASNEYIKAGMCEAYGIVV